MFQIKHFQLKIQIGAVKPRAEYQVKSWINKSDSNPSPQVTSQQPWFVV